MGLWTCVGWGEGLIQAWTQASRWQPQKNPHSWHGFAVPMVPMFISFHFFFCFCTHFCHKSQSCDNFFLHTTITTWQQTGTEGISNANRGLKIQHVMYPRCVSFIFFSLSITDLSQVTIDVTNVYDNKWPHHQHYTNPSLSKHEIEGLFSISLAHNHYTNPSLNQNARWRGYFIFILPTSTTPTPPLLKMWDGWAHFTHHQPWGSKCIRLNVMNIFTKSNSNPHSHSILHSFPTTLIIFSKSNSALFLKILFLTSFPTFPTFCLSISIHFVSPHFFPFLRFYLFLFLWLLFHYLLFLLHPFSLFLALQLLW